MALLTGRSSKRFFFRSWKKNKNSEMHIFWLVLEVGVGWMGVGGGVLVWDGSGEGLGWGLGGWLGVWGRDLGFGIGNGVPSYPLYVILM